MIPIPKAHIPLPPSRLSYGYQRSATHMHQGIDLVAVIGTWVFAAESGRVDRVITRFEPGFSGYGKTVVIQGKSGRWFLYGHLNDIWVEPGQYVLEGDRIGTVGDTAYTRDEPLRRLSTGPHLHFEVSPRPYPQGSEEPRIDPLKFLAEKKTPPATSITGQQKTRRGQSRVQRLYPHSQQRLRY